MALMAPRIEKLTSWDKTRLSYRVWAAEAPIGTALVTHGQAEHSGCYERLAEALVARHWNVVAWDLRGHGLSDGRRGYVASFLDYVQDFIRMREEIGAQVRGRGEPFVVISHSMGGLITLRALTGYPQIQAGIDGAILSSPWLGMAFSVPLIKDVFAGVAARLAPKLTLPNGIQFTDLTRDSSLVPTYATDRLRHNQISAKAYLGALEAMGFASDHAALVSIPVLFQLAGADRIASTQKSEALFTRIGSEHKEKIVYPESFHEIYNDINRHDVFNDLIRFLSGLIN